MRKANNIKGSSLKNGPKRLVIPGKDTPKKSTKDATNEGAANVGRLSGSRSPGSLSSGTSSLGSGSMLKSPPEEIPARSANLDEKARSARRAA